MIKKLIGICVTCLVVLCIFLICRGMRSETSIEEGSKDVLSRLAPHTDFWSYYKDRDPPFSEQNQELDLRSNDSSNRDLSRYTAAQISFDDHTIFPTDSLKLPSGFDRNTIMETHKNPGLNIRKLHQQGIDGRGMSMAIIDQSLSAHEEYNDNLVYYEKIFCHKNHPCDAGWEGSMHGTAIASIAVGKTVGVAPGAKLYYFAADLSDGKYRNGNDRSKIRNSTFFAKALDKILEINKTLPDDQKIVVVSVSGFPRVGRKSEKWNKSLEKAKEAGVFVTTTGLQEEYGLKDNGTYRGVSQDPDSFDSYSQTSWQVGDENWNLPIEVQKNTLCFPSDQRTTASPTGNNDYVHYADGSWSWMKPFEAGMYVLAKQVKPSVTPEEFFKVGLETGHHSQKAKCVIVDPIKLIEKLKQ